jgi:hypothetical protein
LEKYEPWFFNTVDSLFSAVDSIVDSEARHEQNFKSIQSSCRIYLSVGICLDLQKASLPTFNLKAALPAAQTGEG